MLKKICCLPFLLLLSGCTGVALPNAQDMIINLSYSFADLWKLGTAASYVLGFLLAFKAIHHLRLYGEARTMMSMHTNLKTPIIYLFVASALIFMPTMYHVLLLSTFGTGTTSPLDYAGTSFFPPMFMRAFYGLIQVIGLFSFIRGWLIMSRSAEQSSQPGMMGRALTHIIAGLFAINVVGTKNLIFATFGLS